MMTWNLNILLVHRYSVLIKIYLDEFIVILNLITCLSNNDIGINLIIVKILSNIIILFVIYETNMYEKRFWVMKVCQQILLNIYIVTKDLHCIVVTPSLLKKVIQF